MSYNRNYRSNNNQTGWLISVAVGLVALGAAGWYGYSWYSKKREAAAHKDLAENIDEFYNKLGTVKSETFWADIERAFATGAKAHKHSKLYPYFLAYEADALVHQGKFNEAIDVMKTMLSKLDKSNAFYPMYATKLALIKTDAPNIDVQKEGQAELEKLSQDSNNPLQDMALYYLGLLAAHRSDTTKAKEIWHAIVNKADNKSGWYAMAVEKLKAYE